MSGAWVYILTNRPNGTLYVGATNDLVRRVHEHRQGTVKGFSQRYAWKHLVYFEQHAIQRERNMKHWPRAWKVRLINAENSEWRDLYEDLL